MRIRYVQHVDYEGLGHLEPWLLARGHEIAVTRAWEGSFPGPDEFDALVILGGPMGVCDAPQTPWMQAEQDLLRRAVAAGRGVLGICLGGQLLASALGAEVRRHVWPEIGWSRLEPTAAGRESVLAPFFEPAVRVMQWHYDTFDLPEGSELLCSSEACRNQAFRLGSRVIGLQFHPEMTFEEVATVVERDGPVPGGRHVQPVDEILHRERFALLEAAAHEFLARLEEAWTP